MTDKLKHLSQPVTWIAQSNSKSDSGGILVELSLITPILLLLCIGLVELSLLSRAYVSLHSIAYETARRFSNDSVIEDCICNSNGECSGMDAVSTQECFSSHEFSHRWMVALLNRKSETPLGFTLTSTITARGPFDNLHSQGIVKAAPTTISEAIAPLMVARIEGQFTGLFGFYRTTLAAQSEMPGLRRSDG